MPISKKSYRRTFRPLTLCAVLISTISLSACSNDAAKSTDSHQYEILNVSYDVSRDFYKQYNELFHQHYQAKHPDMQVTIKQSHGGSSKQAMSVASGLAADVVTMNQNSDIDLLAQKDLVGADWQNKLPNHAVPFNSTTVLLVRAGNPKGIKDWQDLSRDDVKIVIPNPKTSGNGRYAFLGAYGYGLHSFNGDAQKTDDFMAKLLKNVAVYDSGARAATTTFTQRSIGDVLITAENEANIITHELNKGQFEIIYPSYTVAAENPVAVVDSVAAKKGTATIAHDYLAYLYSDEAQNLAAKLYLRPSNPEILAKHSERFPAMQTFLVGDVFGSWDSVMSTYFKEGAKFDQLAVNAPK